MRLHLFLRLQNLPTAVFASLQINVVRALQVTTIFIFHVGRLLERVMGPAISALHARHFPLWNCHLNLPNINRSGANEPDGVGLV